MLQYVNSVLVGKAQSVVSGYNGSDEIATQGAYQGNMQLRRGNPTSPAGYFENQQKIVVPYPKKELIDNYQLLTVPSAKELKSI